MARPLRAVPRYSIATRSGSRVRACGDRLGVGVREGRGGRSTPDQPLRQLYGFGLIDSRHRDSLRVHQIWGARDAPWEDVGSALGCDDIDRAPSDHTHRGKTR